VTARLNEQEKWYLENDVKEKVTDKNADRRKLRWRRERYLKFFFQRRVQKRKEPKVRPKSLPSQTPSPGPVATRQPNFACGVVSRTSFLVLNEVRIVDRTGQAHPSQRTNESSRSLAFAVNIACFRSFPMNYGRFRKVSANFCEFISYCMSI